MKKSTLLWVWLAGVIFWFNTCACDLSGPSGVISPSNNLDPVIREMWAIAQERLLEDLPDITGDPFSINAEDFRWELMGGMFKCGSTPETAGCFSYKKRRIRVWLERPGAVIHESKHAILFDLGDSRWQCFEHPNEQPCEL